MEVKSMNNDQIGKYGAKPIGEEQAFCTLDDGQVLHWEDCYHFDYIREYLRDEDDEQDACLPDE